MCNRDADKIGTLNPRLDVLAERRRREQQLQDYLAATLDPLERSVFTLLYRDEMPLDAISRLLSLHGVADAENAIISARRKIAKAPFVSGCRENIGVQGEYL